MMIPCWAENPSVHPWIPTRTAAHTSCSRDTCLPKRQSKLSFADSMLYAKSFTVLTSFNLYSNLWGMYYYPWIIDTRSDSRLCNGQADQRGNSCYVTRSPQRCGSRVITKSVTDKSLCTGTVLSIVLFAFNNSSVRSVWQNTAILQMRARRFKQFAGLPTQGCLSDADPPPHISCPSG